MSSVNMDSSLSDTTRARFAREVAKYPGDQKQSAVMACLSIVQKEYGHVSQEAEIAVADYLGMPAIAVHEVTTFYNMYNQHPVGRYKLNVCTNLPCQLRDGQKATERELQEFVAQRAADFKVPKKVLFMAEIPKGATGKLQRIGLAAKLGLG